LHPPYYNQVPLDFLKGLGKKTLDRLLNTFGTEMNILHNVDYEQLRKVVSEEIALQIIKSREGLLDITSGGGGKYGRVKEI